MKNLTLPSFSSIEIRTPFEKAILSWNRRWERALLRFSSVVETEKKYKAKAVAAPETYRTRKIVALLIPKRSGGIYFLEPGENSLLKTKLFLDEKDSLFVGDQRLVSNQSITLGNEEFVFKAIPLVQRFSLNVLEDRKAGDQ